MSTFETSQAQTPVSISLSPGFLGSTERRWFWGVLLISLLLRLLTLALAPLMPEEAYYWMYARHPSLSYFDHPAMVAWFIQLGTLVFGNTAFGVRIVNDLVMLGASGMMYAFARQWWGRRASIWAALSLQILPVYFGVGFAGMMDGALLFWWLLCLLGISLAVRKQRTMGWYLAGIGFGLAMQSKYSAVFLAPGALLLLLLHRPYRRHLKSIHPWLGFFIGLALFTPTLLWNAQNHWASFRFQFLSRSDGDPFNIRTVLNFVMFQFAVLTPMVLLGAVVALVRLLRQRGIGLRRRWSAGWVMAFAFCLPLVAALGWKSLREAHVNWTIPAWLSLLPALAHLLHARLRLRRRRTHRGFDWRPGMKLTAWICIAVNIGLLLYLLLIQPRYGGIHAFGPWRPLARAVQKQVTQLETQTGRPVLLIAEGKYRLASVLAFYRLADDPAATQNTTSQWILSGQGLGYEFWTDQKQWIGRDCVYVAESADDFSGLSRRFRKVVVLPPIRLPLHPPYTVALCYDLRPALTTAATVSHPEAPSP